MFPSLPCAALTSLVLGIFSCTTSTEPMESVDGKLSNNGLVPDEALLPMLSVQPLGGADSTTESVLFAADHFGPLSDSDSGRSLLSYLALCALDTGTDLVVRDPAGETRYPGLYGLAPEWAGSDCDLSCQRWVSACVLAHTNASGAAVQMSLRGPHPGFAWTDAHRSEFAFQEAAFYGNLFTSDATSYSCAGRGYIDAAVSLTDVTDYLVERMCTAGVACGVVLTGACQPDAPLFNGACAHDSGADGYYESCATALFFGAASPGFDEVVTVYLR